MPPRNDQEVKRPLLFCVVQGGIDFELREYCVKELTKIGFDGYGFGGWAINEKEYFPYDLLNNIGLDTSN
jgi:queuine tRNA-ribosyltransferase